ncbi:hypothetical protein C8R43DRAFT_1138805 [Mycena crocata]|nr:hypothetical protein C8R43DRAFT_1138805 [Mycena crocata]
MSLTLPIHTLSGMQVSFKFGFANGTFAFNMVSGDSGEMFGVDATLKLHMSAVGDSTGVTLTLSVSGELKAQFPEEAVGNMHTLAHTSQESLSPPADVQSSHDCTLNDPEHEHGLGLLLNSGDPSIPDLGFGLHAIENLNIADQSFDGFNSHANAHSVLETDFPCLGLVGWEGSVMDIEQYITLDIEAMFSGSSSLLDISQFEHPRNYLPSDADSSADDSTPTSPANAGTPVSSRSSPSRSSTPQRSSGSRRDLRCPHPTCDLYFATSYKLAKHTTTHAPKSPKQFPCTMGCALEFSRKHDRLRHEVAQHGRIRYRRAPILMFDLFPECDEDLSHPSYTRRTPTAIKRKRAKNESVPVHV